MNLSRDANPTSPAHPASWTKAWLLACLATYGPFVVIALYTLAFVSCPHCKRTYCSLLPLSPGLLASFITAGALTILKSAFVLYSISSLYSLLMLFGIASLVRRSGAWCHATLGISAALFFVLALLTLALIRA
jgi:hypothetical protein